MAALLAAAWPVGAAPQRVVSMNLCSDQIAMLLAAPGQLVSVSSLTQDPAMSPMARQALAYAPNSGRAEEIYLMRPDLVIAGTYTPGATVAMLRRLGIRVEIRPPAETLDAIRTEITDLGQLLGRIEAASALRQRYDRDLAALHPPADRGRAAIYQANGFTSGDRTLAGTILTAAGYRNIAADYGITATTMLPMELLVMSDPDRLVTGKKSPGQSRGEAILDHPALAAVETAPRHITDRTWTCGTPFILDAIRSLK